MACLLTKVKRRLDPLFLKKELFAFLGEGFENAYNSGRLICDTGVSITGYVDFLTSGRSQGEIINISVIRQFRDLLTSERANKALALNDAYVKSTQGFFTAGIL